KDTDDDDKPPGKSSRDATEARRKDETKGQG
ncbi:MAG: hypothetical protein K0R70_1763, partial [Steroidobacteraceae bacterium]|nr:hypothetical protein [Steroidobacteraceae bacterium]